MKKLTRLMLFVLSLQVSVAYAQQNHKTENVIIVTLDGFRWQEVFKGIDDSLVVKKYCHDSADIKHRFGAGNAEDSRKKLLPFLWSEIASKGQIYGNRAKGSKVNNANRYKFSYPGYNEIFTGFPDDSVNSNNKAWNKNENVLEFINKKEQYNGKVACFSTWDVFPYILNEKRSGIYVNADVDTLHFNQPQLSLINDMQFLTTRPIGVRPDVFTYFAAREYLKAYSPKVLYIAFDETDDFAHAGMYDQYLNSAHAQDAMIADLWRLIQSTPQYKDKTTLIITCDHGRGDQLKENWKHHGEKIQEAGEIWFAVLGPDTRPAGEISVQGQFYQMQFATTIAAFLGIDFKPVHPVAAPIKEVFTGF